MELNHHAEEEKTRDQRLQDINLNPNLEMMKSNNPKTISILNIFDISNELANFYCINGS
jgi:hypothetical protein